MGEDGQLLVNPPQMHFGTNTHMASAQTRRRSLLCLLLVAHFANNFIMVHPYPYDPMGSLLVFWYMTLYGVTTSQPVLLAMWAVFGRERLAIRSVLPVLTLTFVTAGPIVILPRGSHQQIWDILPTYCGYQIALFATSGALFLLMRGFLSWRIVPLEAEDRALVQVSRPKLALPDLFGLTAFCALGLAALRVFGTYMSATPWPLTRDGLHSLVALALLPLLLVDKRPARMYRWLIAALAVDLVISAALVYRGSNGFLLLLRWLEFSTGFFGSVASSLWVVRAAGYRLSRKDGVAGADELAATTAA
jgi:hypothetical protein